MIRHSGPCPARRGVKHPDDLQELSEDCNFRSGQTRSHTKAQTLRVERRLRCLFSTLSWRILWLKDLSRIPWLRATGWVWRFVALAYLMHFRGKCQGFLIGGFGVQMQIINQMLKSRSISPLSSWVIGQYRRCWGSSSFHLFFRYFFNDHPFLASIEEMSKGSEIKFLGWRSK